MIQLHLKIELTKGGQKESFSFGKSKVSYDEIKAKTIELMQKFLNKDNIDFSIGY